MKNIFSVAILIVALSVGYYFAIYLPHKDQQQLQIQQQQAQQSQSFEKQKQCQVLGEKAYNQDVKDSEGLWLLEDQNYHYNQKLNTCLYGVEKTSTYDAKSNCIGYLITVTDILSNKTLLSITQNAPTCQTTMSRDAFDKDYQQLFSE